MAAACWNQELTLFQLPDGFRSRSADPSAQRNRS